MQVEARRRRVHFSDSLWRKEQLISSTEMDDNNYGRKIESSLNFTHDFWKGIKTLDIRI